MPKKKPKTRKEHEALAEENKKKLGAPTFPFNDAIATLICEAISSIPRGMEFICATHPDFPCKTTINIWRLHHPSFAADYKTAKLVQANLLAEDMLDIADDSTHDTTIGKHGLIMDSEYVARSRLRIDTRKWLSSQLLPDDYGSTINVDVGGDKAKEVVVKGLAKVKAKKNVREF